ncbi:MAG: cbb3-type cytochrome oxidase assembly protein CcoS [Campylobacterota bacterium]|nr:cbb3-type cytochrome oxidase assembly protein CcoS [Campylobacterota bacterium]
MSENIVIMMISVSTFLGALGLIALLWGVKTGQFDDQSKFIDATQFDNEEDLRDAVMMEKKREARAKNREEKKKREREKERKAHYMPAD